MSMFIQRLPGEGSVEDQEIQTGIIRAVHPGGVWEYGVYVERLDDAEWTPLVYAEMSESEAQDHYKRLRRGGMPFRRARVLRRVVGPWEERQ